MSKLAERLRALRTRRNRRIGFGALAGAKEAGQASMLIGVRGDPVEGADLVLGAESALSSASDGTLVGLEPEALTPNATQRAVEAGAAFVVVRPETAQADALLSEKLDYVVRIPEGLEDEAALRALGTLRPTLALAASVPEPISLSALLSLRRLAMLVGAPLALGVSKDVSDGSLEVLRDSGVAALIVDSATPEVLADVRERVAKLPVRRRTVPPDAEAIVPGVQAHMGEGDEPEPDE